MYIALVSKLHNKHYEVSMKLQDAYQCKNLILFKTNNYNYNTFYLVYMFYKNLQSVILNTL